MHPEFTYGYARREIIIKVFVQRGIKKVQN